MGIELFLVDPTNEFQQLLKDEAEAAAQRSGVAIRSHFTGDDFGAQLTEIRKRVADRPEAVLVLAVRDRGLARVAAEAARAGVHWVFLNRSDDDLGELRDHYPSVALTTVCPDEVETGRVQGRLMKRLLGSSGRVLYVQGSRRSLAARDRTVGVEEVTRDSGLDLTLIEAGWSAAESTKAVGEWLRVALPAGMRLDLVAGQNDLIASGATAALSAAAAETGQRHLVSLPVVGCDGTPRFGQRLVREGKLAATVVLPRWSGLAVETIARTLASGTLPPPMVLVAATAFPAEAQVKRAAIAGSS
jgi:ABC-type sugar transport system substrate-binding protein